TPELERLAASPDVRQAMQNAVTRGQNRSVAERMGPFNPPAPTMQFWDYAQRELRDMQTVASRAGRNEEAGALRMLRRDMLAELDGVNPAFARARQGAAGFFGGENALEAGHNFVTMNAGTPAQQLAARRAFNRMT